MCIAHSRPVVPGSYDSIFLSASLRLKAGDRVNLFNLGNGVLYDDIVTSITPPNLMVCLWKRNWHFIDYWIENTHLLPHLNMLKTIFFIVIDFIYYTGFCTGYYHSNGTDKNDSPVHQLLANAPFISETMSVFL